MSKVQGTVKWFSNRKGFGFVSPTTDNSPTSEDIFVHHSAIQSEGEYRTLVENMAVEFDVEKDDAGKFKATNVTMVGGSPVKPPPKREPRARSSEAAGGGLDENGGGGGGGRGPRGRRGPPKSGGRAAAAVGTGPANPPREKKEAFHSIMTAAAKEAVKSKGIDLGTKLTIDLALGDARVKLGQGGYCSYCTADAKIYEGSFICDENGSVSFTWARALAFADGSWKLADPSTGMPSLSLTNDAIGPVGDKEKPSSLWGEDKPDPIEAFKENGFSMRKVHLTRPPVRVRRGKPPGNKGGGEAAE